MHITLIAILFFVILYLSRSTPVAKTMAAAISCVALWRGIWILMDALDRELKIIDSVGGLQGFGNAALSIVVGLVIVVVFATSKKEIWGILASHF